MPPPNKEKKGSLTLEKLACYDDVITDALVDKVYYWTTIRKNRGGRFTASRGLHEEDIAEIIRQNVIWNKDAAEAVQDLLKLSGLNTFVRSLKSESEREHFKRHLRRYANIYLPDCPFEVTTTNRYTITDHEASITARRDINPREEIKYLTGVQVVMTEEQEKSLELARKDFSLVISSRRKTRSLFLGPARFANHDCDANAKLSTKGYDGMQIVAVKPINEGQEITVSYGDDYFGENNDECLCRTCESLLQNGWSPMKRVDIPEVGEDLSLIEAKESSPAPDVPQPPLKRLRSNSIDDHASRSSTPDSKRAKVEPIVLQARSPPPKHLLETTLKKAHESNQRQEVPVLSIEYPSTNFPSSPQASRNIRNQQREGLLTVSLDEASSSRDLTPQSPLTEASPKSSHSTNATSVDGEHPPHIIIVKVEMDIEKLRDEQPALKVAMIDDEIITTTVNATWPHPQAEDDALSELSQLSSRFEFDSLNEQIVKRKLHPTLRTTRSRSRFENYNRIGTPVLAHNDDDAVYIPNERRPGDYMTSSSLLSAKYSKWVGCQTCEAQFVQQDGYNTRKECPRCERHSKLYGFAWPKTEREGKHDKEQRILDHRTVHRFVDPDEERQLRRDKTKKVMKENIHERFSTPRSGRDRDSMSASVEVESGRRRRRIRQTL